MFARFDIEKERLEEFPQRLGTLLDEQLRKIEEIAAAKDAGYEDVIKRLEEMDEQRALFFTPLSHLNSVMNSEETKKAYEESIAQLSLFHSRVSQNRALYEKIKAIESDDIYRKRVLQNEIRDFRLSGADLDEEGKRELEEIDLKLSELSNRFAQNLLDATNSWEMVVESEEDVEGIPEEELAKARFEEDGRVKYRFTLQMPSYIAYMTYGPNRELREKIYRAYTTRAPENAEVIDEILRLREKKARLLGFDSYASYALQTRDARSEDEVMSFLENLLKLSIAAGRAEIEELGRFALREDGLEELESFDIAYYSQKLKRELFDYDENMSRPYFEKSRVVKGVLGIVEELFGYTFRKNDMRLWHESVECYDIYRDGELSARIYFDLEARREKRGGAWMHDWETRFLDSRGELHLPSAFVVANFSPAQGGEPSLLRHDDVVTLFHEMGHAIHHLFSAMDERSISGINGVAWDVVEFPSQFLENFAYEAPILERFAYHYRSGEKIPTEILGAIKRSKNFQAAMAMLRQLEFAIFDFRLHMKLYQGAEVRELLESVRERTALVKTPAYNRFEHGFSHIFAGGYAAGYYSYKWAEVLSADAFFACVAEDGSFDREKADGYAKNILSQGGAEDMSTLYRRWLGRRARPESLLELYDIGSGE